VVATTKSPASRLPVVLAEETERKTAAAAADVPLLSSFDTQADVITGDTRLKITLEDINKPRTLTSDQEKHLDTKFCPEFKLPPKKTADRSATVHAMTKYQRYVEDYCNTTGFLQMHLGFHNFIKILDGIAQRVELKKGHKVFDWGSGCGTLLNYYAVKYGTVGVGIDIVQSAVDHARRHAQPQQLFCHADGTSSLMFWKKNTFDAVVSWATIYHIRRTMQQCHVVTEMVDLVKPGGYVFVGHFRTDKSTKYWNHYHKKCLIPNTTMQKRHDATAFHMTKFRHGKFMSILIRKHTAEEIALEKTKKKKEEKKNNEEEKEEDSSASSSKDSEGETIGGGARESPVTSAGPSLVRGVSTNNNWPPNPN